MDEDYVLVDTRSGLDFAIEGLPSGATVLIAVAATNSGGDSARTEAVTLVMPV